MSKVTKTRPKILKMSGPMKKATEYQEMGQKDECEID